MIYLDSAATSLMRPGCVYEAVQNAFLHAGSSGRGAHGASLYAARILYKARTRLAKLFHFSAPERTVFSTNVTEALNMALYGLLGPQDHVISTVLEHNAVLRPLYRLEDRGMGLTLIGADAHGVPHYESFAQALQPNTKAVVCTLASNVTGYYMDMAFIRQFCRAHGLLLIADTAQAAGSRAIDMEEMGIDVLCFTGHKGLLGPQGTGGMCLSPAVSIPPLTVGGSGIHSYSRAHPDTMPEALEAGTPNAHGAAGLSAGVEYVLKAGVEAIHQKEAALCTRLYNGLREIRGLQFYGVYDTTARAPIVALNVKELDSTQVCDALARGYDICTRAGAHCAPLMHAALGTTERGIVRLSVSQFNTEEEIDRAVRAVGEIAASA